MTQTTVTDDAPKPASYADSGSAKPATKASKNRMKTFLIIATIFAVLIGGGLLWWLLHRGIEETDNATISGHLHPISPRVAGTIKQVLVDDNDLVKAGQPVAIIDDEDMRITLSQVEHQLAVTKSQAQAAKETITFTERQAASQVKQAQGALGISHASAKQAQQAVREAKAAVASAREALAQQDATYGRAQSDYRRYAALDPDAVSGQQLDSAKANLLVADAARKASSASLLQSEARLKQVTATVPENASRIVQAHGGVQGAQAQSSQVAVVRSQYDNALAQIKVAEDQVRQARLNLSYTLIKAPADGRIGRKTVEVGQRVQPGEPLMSVVSNKAWIIANFKETQLANMLVGQPVEIEVDSFPGHKFEGRVQSFSPASGAEFALLPPENATGNFTKVVQRIPVKILFDAKTVKGYETRLTPGMSVLIKVNTNVKPDDNKSESTKETNGGMIR